MARIAWLIPRATTVFACAVLFHRGQHLIGQVRVTDRQTLTGDFAAANIEVWLDTLIPRALAETDIAGLTIAITHNGTILLEKGYGFADVSTRTPMDPVSTVLRVASISKSFTATAVMQLVEQGQLSLDADINTYLDFSIPPAFGQPITLRHLLTHTAGFAETAYKRYQVPQTLRVSLVPVPDRIYPPGTIPAYSNYGLSLAGHIVARVSGQSFADYVTRHVLEPLGMTRSTFRPTIPAELAPFTAQNYPRASEPPFPASLYTELSPVDAPASGLAATANDMAAFMLAHLQEGRYQDLQIIRPETVRLMHDAAFVPMPGAQPIALGFFRTDYRGRRVLAHSGDGEGAHAEIKLMPDEGVGLFVAVNSDGVTEGILPAAFTLRARIFEEFVDRFLPAPAADEHEEPTTATAPAHARLVAGEYEWSRKTSGDYRDALGLIQRFVLDLGIRANPDGTIETPGLLTFNPAGRAQTWREVGPFRWREVGGDAHLVMNVRDGVVQSVWSDQSASFWVSVPVPLTRSARVHVPLLGLTLLALVLTMVSWPVAALVRRHRGTRLADAGRIPRLTRVPVALGVVYLLGWGVAMAADLASTVGAEPWIRLLQGIGLLCVIGAVTAAWNVWHTGRRDGVLAAAGKIVPALALIYLAWFSLAFHLIGPRAG